MPNSRFLPILFVVMSACAADDSVPESTPAESVGVTTTNASGLVYVDPLSRWRFNLVDRSIQVENKQYDPALPLQKIRERFKLKNAEDLLVHVDIWSSPQVVELHEWIDTYASYLHDGTIQLRETTAGKLGVKAMVADQARSCRSANILTAFFAIADDMIAITCADAENPVARRAFDVALASFSMKDTQ